ncbi:UDP-N-acetylglucosamine 2-epimerase [Campylobacter mucosalis]|uniref:UDP-N-acetylglucosamine 2-epimerase n=1 Tax=Campylobacter mucosalis TaxID=202 RepID=UPI0015930C76|nr:UDP-N-acetylglucosamine 2-epimerase [Campylobacter mucosalis]QKF63255.1 UDP-N-acetylglucosamine 2-epimerase [Campylobacter mucosalis]
MLAKKKLLFITGTRADFGKLKPLLSYIEKSDEFELFVIVTGMHMLSLYGSTYREVIKQNYKNIYLINNQFIDEPMGSILGNSINILSRFFTEINPDMVFVHGDRIEALAGALAACFERKLVCHIEGGELSGTIDDSIRHAISKFAHIHLVANNEAKNRLIKMGENKGNIFIIGSPDIDVMSSNTLPNLKDAKEYYDIDFNSYAISMFHPVTTEFDYMQEYTKQYFKAIDDSNKNFIVIYPNNDLGSKFILSQIDKMRDCKKFKIFPSIRFEYFLVLLKNAEFIIGNSSAGVREAPFYGVNTINVGTRQNNRSTSKFVYNCWYDSNEILKAISNLKPNSPLNKDTSFGSGDSLSKFIEFIHNDKIWQTNLQKVFVE